ncbi:MAG: metallophosphoesterase, partial [Gemmatimonadota bacterium]|nr:metallophosphoesterase [Gemmatimonadota bacterium]
MHPVAALYDIHGNLPALETVLEDVASAGARAIVAGGDIVPGPMPGRTLEALAAAPAPVRFLRGNGENDVLAARR